MNGQELIDLKAEFELYMTQIKKNVAMKRAILEYVRAIEKLLMLTFMEMTGGDTFEGIGHHGGEKKEKELLQ